MFLRAEAVRARIFQRSLLLPPLLKLAHAGSCGCSADCCRRDTACLSASTAEQGSQGKSMQRESNPEHQTVNERS